MKKGIIASGIWSCPWVLSFNISDIKFVLIAYLAKNVAMTEAVNKAKNDSSIKAVVLRVNSPGGSALASDVIWRSIEKTKEVKPVIVSMGDVAASGGYYISCGADRIFAEPNTITGSIGVFGMIPNIGKMMENKIGITFDRVETNEHAAFSMFGELDKKELSIFGQIKI